MTSWPTFTVRVGGIRREATDILSFELLSAEAAPLPPFTAGSHIDVHIRHGVIRQYSLCNGPGDVSRYLIAVKREPRSKGGSAALHDVIREGDLLRISAPRNNFPLDWTATHHLLLAGGIGVTPMLSMALHLKAAGAHFQLQYFTRSIEHTAFHELLAGQLVDNVVFHYGLEPEGLGSLLREILSRRPDGSHLYLCGPRPFMDLVATTARASWAAESVHLEYFGADPMSLAGNRAAFSVQLASSGRTYLVPEGRTIVEALAAHGVRIETSCEQGVCGSCLTGVLAGVPEHRDVYLNDEEKRVGDRIIACVSRSKTSVLVLDL
jgi:vanillate monooxygenase ferredoxin subunit